MSSIEFIPKILKIDISTETYTNNVKIANNSNENFAFKVKTNNPRVQVVNPAYGIVEAKKTFTLIIKSKTTADYKCKTSDKFLVQQMGCNMSINTDPNEVSAFLTANAKQSLTYLIETSFFNPSTDNIDQFNSPMPQFPSGSKSILKTRSETQSEGARSMNNSFRTVAQDLTMSFNTESTMMKNDDNNNPFNVKESTNSNFSISNGNHSNSNNRMDNHELNSNGNGNSNGSHPNNNNIVKQSKDYCINNERQDYTIETKEDNTSTLPTSKNTTEKVNSNSNKSIDSAKVLEELRTSIKTNFWHMTKQRRLEEITKLENDEKMNEIWSTLQDLKSEAKQQPNINLLIQVIILLLVFNSCLLIYQITSCNSEPNSTIQNSSAPKSTGWL